MRRRKDADLSPERRKPKVIRQIWRFARTRPPSLERLSKYLIKAAAESNTNKLGIRKGETWAKSFSTAGWGEVATSALRSLSESKIRSWGGSASSFGSCSKITKALLPRKLGARLLPWRDFRGNKSTNGCTTELSCPKTRKTYSLKLWSIRSSLATSASSATCTISLR